MIPKVCEWASKRYLRSRSIDLLKEALQEDLKTAYVAGIESAVNQMSEYNVAMASSKDFDGWVNDFMRGKIKRVVKDYNV